MQKGQDSLPKARMAVSLGVAALVVALVRLGDRREANPDLLQMELLPGFLDLISVDPNSGCVFGLLANQTFLLITITIASLLVILLFLRYLSPATTLGIVSIGLILGGAVGNLIDRLRFDCVTDFIHIHIHNLLDWPYIFNLADTAIVIGTFTFIYSLYRAGLFRKVYEHDHKTKD